ncbi:MAG: glucose-6-phosphate isomerase [Planctomycetota bacterium]|nr:MAG: glucose-6-phosphate isomerase [Planctomycetota bacterium]
MPSLELALDNGFRLNASGFCLHKTQTPLWLEEELQRHRQKLEASFQAITRLQNEGKVSTAPGKETSIGFVKLPHLPRQNPKLWEDIFAWQEKILKNYKNLIVIGIGGSYLGGKMLVEALSSPLRNLRITQGKESGVRLFFAGENVDPIPLECLMETLDPQQSALLVISKSGTTLEPTAAFLTLARWRGAEFAHHTTAITDPHQGALRDFALRENIPLFPIPPDVGGRWSVLSPVGLLVAAAAGIDIENLLAGARHLETSLKEKDIWKNPPFLYATLMHLAQLYGRTESVIMPYSSRLLYFAQWYVQLLAESLGKKYTRQGYKIHTGRTPIVSIGTSDMHSQTQLHQDGPRNKVITFLRIQNHPSSLEVPPLSRTLEGEEKLKGRKFQDLLHAALDANQKALQEDHRPYVEITLPQLNAYYFGELIYFFQFATAWEGELLDVNSYDQPGVEQYKRHLQQQL